MVKKTGKKKVSPSRLQGMTDAEMSWTLLTGSEEDKALIRAERARVAKNSGHGRLSSASDPLDSPGVSPSATKAAGGKTPDVSTLFLSCFADARRETCSGAATDYLVLRQNGRGSQKAGQDAGRLPTAPVNDRLVTRGGCRDGGGNPESSDEAGRSLTGPSLLERKGKAGEAPPKQEATDKEGRVVADESAAVKEKADRSRLVVASRPSEDSNSQEPLRDPAKHVPGGDVLIGSRPEGTCTGIGSDGGSSVESTEGVRAAAALGSSGEDRCGSTGQLEESTAKLIKVDGGKREAEAHSNMGRVHSEHGQLEKAAEHYEAFHHLTLGRAWKDETGRSYKSQACESLWRIYTLLADKMLENKEHEQAIKTLIKAFEMARETGDKKIEGEAAYRVGAAYNSSGDPETAITYLEMSMQIFTELGDKDGIGKTCQALAKAYESQGNIEETMKYLEQFVAVAESSEHSESLLEACMSLGEISNMRGQYERGFEYFEKAYDISKKLKDLKQIQKAQVYIGISKAHIMMATFSSHIKAGGRVNTESLLAWKDN